ncbi:MAG: amidohydrolase family protein [Planctomycetota bacterium]|jgi:predicted TIM-barrel fold metal-dependent hydrolase
MIIDLHTHVWASLDQLGREVADCLRRRNGDCRERLDASPAAHERAMTCVDGAVVLGFRADRLGAFIPNELIADFAAKDPRRRVGVAGIDPMSADVLDQIESAVGLGLVGVTVSPVAQGFHPTHSTAMRAYERCAELRLPVFVTLEEPLTASAALEYARPAAWDEVARSLPSLPIIISELGHPRIDETLLLVGKNEHVYADISGVASRPWQLYNALLNASSFGVMDKLLFGSGFPHDTPARAIEALYTVNACSHGTQLPSIARSSIRAIIEQDSLATLGIDAEIASTPREPQAEDAEVPVVDVIRPAPPSKVEGADPAGQA